MENNILTDKQEYYTPELSDFYEGFEFEILYPNNKWVKQVYGKSIKHMELQQFSDDLDKIAHAIVRVPYLTKAQIETEGWKFKGKSVDLWWEKEGTFDTGSFRVYKIIMHYGMKGHIGNQDLKMHIYAEDQGTEYDLFRGEVKSINEFRKLQNWLGIK